MLFQLSRIRYYNSVLITYCCEVFTAVLFVCVNGFRRASIGLRWKSVTGVMNKFENNNSRSRMCVCVCRCVCVRVCVFINIAVGDVKRRFGKGTSEVEKKIKSSKLIYRMRHMCYNIYIIYILYEHIHTRALAYRNYFFVGKIIFTTTF